MQKSNLVVFDFETGDSAKSSCEVIQIAAACVDPRTLKVYEDNTFESLMKPLDFGALKDDALRVNGKTREQLANAPHPAEVWARFADWVKQWGGSEWSAPIACGHNIVNFDWVILERYARQYGTVRVEKNGESSQNLFHPLIRYDTLQMLGAWSEDQADWSKLSLDFLRRYFKIPASCGRDAHDALRDVLDTAAILTRLLNLHRTFARKTIWKGAFCPEDVEKERERRRAAKETARR